MNPRVRTFVAMLTLLLAMLYALERFEVSKWYASLFDGVWTVFVVWAVVVQVPRLERHALPRMPRPWWVIFAAGIGAVILERAIWASRDAVTHFSAPLRVALIHGGLSVALLALIVLSFSARNPRFDPSQVPLHRWLALVASVLLLTPPFLLFAKIGQLVLVMLSMWMLWLRELPALEDARPTRTWQLRARAFVLGLSVLALFVVLGSKVFGRWPVADHDPLLVSVLKMSLLPPSFAALSLLFAVAFMSASDGFALALRRSRSVRTRMLVLGFCCAGFALALASVDPLRHLDPSSRLRPSVRPFFNVVLLVGTVFAFSVTLSKGLSRALEQSMRALSEVRRGNLDVALDDSGRDELAVVARSFNDLVRALREAEFLEKINADLRSRSTQLVQTLDALRTAQADLVRSERMASVATLVKGIAHELNNPINYIAGNVPPLQRYCEFLTRVASEFSDGRPRSLDEIRHLTRLTETKDLAFVSEDLARLTADIGEGARRAKLIIDDLQSLTSVTQRGVERVDLHVIARQTISLLRPSVPPGVELNAKFDPVSELAARAGQLEQVLVNLTDNAIRAVGERGTVQIFVGAANGQALVRVHDDGVGMSEEVKRQAFEPFFTTRPAGAGSGLGLAIVASIVRAHRGTITLTSEPGLGTSVELRLPLDPDAILAAELLSPSNGQVLDPFSTK